jgi:hypothetical protein
MSQKNLLCPREHTAEESQQYYIIAPYNIQMLEINPPRESHSLASNYHERNVSYCHDCLLSLAYLSSQFSGLNLKLSPIFFAYAMYLLSG